MKQRSCHHIYPKGLGGYVSPRRLLARTELHRIWLSGRNRVFEVGGVQYGPANPYRGESP